MTLTELLLSPENQPQVIQDCIHLIENEVSQKKGLTGVAVKTGFKILTTLKDGLLEELLKKLLPEFVETLEPFYEKFTHSPATDFKSFLESQSEEVVQALLSVTDKRAEKAKNKTLKSGYQKLRGAATKHVSQAIPGLANVISKYIQSSV